MTPRRGVCVSSDLKPHLLLQCFLATHWYVSHSIGEENEKESKKDLNPFKHNPKIISFGRETSFHLIHFLSNLLILVYFSMAFMSPKSQILFSSVGVITDYWIRRRPASSYSIRWASLPCGGDSEKHETRQEWSHQVHYKSQKVHYVGVIGLKA